MGHCSAATGNKPNLSFKHLNVYLGQVAWLCDCPHWNRPFSEAVRQQFENYFPDLDFDRKRLYVFLQNCTFLCMSTASLLKEVICF